MPKKIEFARTVLLPLLLGCAPALFAFQAAPAATGSIEGRVVNSVSGDPVRRVELTLSPTRGKAKPVSAQSDENGRFAFRELAPGGYRLSGQKNGYLHFAFGARLNPEVGEILALAAGQSLKEILFKLPPNAVLSGTVLDQEGQPLPSIVVQALRSGYVAGRRQWFPAGSAQTNDRGEFRVSGLRAGRYLVGATDLNLTLALAGRGTEPLSDKPEQGYASTYYGNTPDLSRAAPLDLSTGDDRRGITIQLTKTATVRIRGKASGVPDGAVLLMLLLRKGARSGANANGGMAMVQQADSTFEIRNVTPGSYLLTSIVATSPTAPVGALPLEVGEQHLEGVEFHTDSGREVPGRVIVSGGDPAAASETHVMLMMVDYDWPAAPDAHPAADGRFTLKGIFPARYRLAVSDLPENAYIKSVRFAGRDVDETSFDVAGAGELEIALSTAGAHLEGLVRDADEKPLSGATVVLIPDPPRETRYATATSFEDGTFEIKGVAPGKYKVLAWRDLEPGAYRDPDFIKPFEAKAQAVALQENGRSKLTLQVVEEK